MHTFTANIGKVVPGTCLLQAGPRSPVHPETRYGMSLAMYLLLSPYHSGVFTAYSLQPRAYQQVAIPLADAFIYRTICFRVRLTVPTRNIPENIEGRPPQFRSRLSNTDLHWQGPIEPSDFSHQSGTVTAVSTYSVQITKSSS
jgi:hypothetical protein